MKLAEYNCQLCEKGEKKTIQFTIVDDANVGRPPLSVGPITGYLHWSAPARARPGSAARSLERSDTQQSPRSPRTLHTPAADTGTLHPSPDIGYNLEVWLHYFHKTMFSTNTDGRLIKYGFTLFYSILLYRIRCLCKNLKSFRQF